MVKNIFLCFLFVCWMGPLWAFDHTHSQFDKILKKYVFKKGSTSEVDYKALKLKKRYFKKILGFTFKSN